MHTKQALSASAWRDHASLSKDLGPLHNVQPQNVEIDILLTRLTGLPSHQKYAWHDGISLLHNQ